MIAINSEKVQKLQSAFDLVANLQLMCLGFFGVFFVVFFFWRNGYVYSKFTHLWPEELIKYLIQSPM